MTATREERTFVYGFRVGHCVEGIVSFAIIEVLGVWKLQRASSTFSEVVGGAIAAFAAFLIISMTAWLVIRKRGSKHVIVGASSLRAPAAARLTAREIEVRFADIESMTVRGGKKGALRIEHSGGTLDIGKVMLGTDAEFDELVALMRDRAAK